MINEYYITPKVAVFCLPKQGLNLVDLLTFVFMCKLNMNFIGDPS